MNTFENPDQEPIQPTPETAPNPTPQPEAQTPPRRCAFQSLCNAVNDGASRARRAADQTAPKIKSVAEGAAYWAAFGISYASVFSWTLARNLAPESAKAGYRAGCSSGKQAAETAEDRLRRRGEAPITEDRPEAGTYPSLPEPSGA